MIHIFILHGTGSTPQSNWFPWLRESLQKQGHAVYVPRFPTPGGQSLENWLKVLSPEDERLEGAILIGHSLAPAFILNLLERTSHHVRAVFLVAGFVGLLRDDYFDPLIASFVDREFDWEQIRAHCQSFTLFQSKDDPYVPFERGEYLAEKLGGELIALEQAGHINIDSGFVEFPQLLEKLVGDEAHSVRSF